MAPASSLISSLSDLARAFGLQRMLLRTVHRRPNVLTVAVPAGPRLQTVACKEGAPVCGAP